MQPYQENFIRFLVQSNALKFGDFTLKSGRKCPYFLNLGQFCKGSLISELAKYYVAALKEKIKDFDVIFGPAYKGIPLSVAITLVLFQDQKMDVGYSFNRKEAKNHGEGGMLVGSPMSADSKVVIVDDVMTAGTALRESLMLLQSFGPPQIKGVLIAVDRMEKGQGEKSATQEMRDEFGIEVFSIVTLQDIIDYLSGRSIDGKIYLDEERLEQITKYRQQYGVV
jgi:orotate phosphoribosyltransferase